VPWALLLPLRGQSVPPRFAWIIAIAQCFPGDRVVGQRELKLRIERPLNLRAAGWVTADTHVHFISPQTAWLEAQGEGVNLVNLLASQWGDLFTNVGDLTGDLSGVSRDDTLTGHSDAVLAVAVRPDREWAISGSSDGMLKVWDLERASTITTFGGDSRLWSCAFAPDGLNIVAGAGSGQLHILRLEGVV
jgi:hypothetical protein